MSTLVRHHQRTPNHSFAFALPRMVLLYALQQEKTSFFSFFYEKTPFFKGAFWIIIL